nr:hypothetical protein [Armatimonas sp.]
MPCLPASLSALAQPPAGYDLLAVNDVIYGGTLRKIQILNHL